MDYTKHSTNRVATPQTEKVPGVKKQKRNNAGGIAFKISKWDYMQRFLILGTEGGTYYVGEAKLTKDACKNVEKCIAKNGKRAVDLIVEISKEGRAANNDAAIFALALAASCDSLKTRKYALANLSQVCRIGTHLFHFIKFVKTMRGFGRSLREGIAKWYTHKSLDQLAYQMLKYQQRDGWSHRDVLRQCHAIPLTEEQDALFAYAVGKSKQIPRVSDYAIGAEMMCTVENATQGSKIIKQYKLTREVIPTELLNDISTWNAMLDHMPIGALVRNLGKMASIGMHKPFCLSEKTTIAKLTDPIAVKKSKIHPLQVCNALMVYRQGRGIKGSLTWEVNGKVTDALEEMFYMSFKNVEPTGKNIMLALDVSGSMTFDKLPGSLMDCRDASGVLAMVTMRTEPNTFVAGFTGGGGQGMRLNRSSYGGSDISMLPITKNHTLDSVINTISGLPFGRTDCALPMEYCQKLDIDVDAIVVYTDNETYAGRVHPWQALERYERHIGHSVKLIVVGMTATGFSIAKPDAPNMLDVVGFDTNTPAMISNFIR